MKRRIPFATGCMILGVAILGLSMPGAAGAMGLAPAGPCAEPDELSLAIGAGDPEERAGTPALAAGPARHRFAPTSVGAGLPPSTAALGPPKTTRASHPGACGSAGSVCGGRVAPNPQPVAATRTTPRRRPRNTPRVVVDPNPGTGCGGPGFGCE